MAVYLGVEMAVMEGVRNSEELFFRIFRMTCTDCEVKKEH